MSRTMHAIDKQSRIGAADSFVRLVAAMTLDGEIVDGAPFEWTNDDAWSTLHELIGAARAIERGTIDRPLPGQIALALR